MKNNCIANNSHIILSFKYSVKNKNYTMEKLGKTKGKYNKIIQNLFEKLEDISKITWEEFKNRPKETGYETIPVSDFKINFDNLKKSLKLSEDSKIIVIRFNNQKCRILGVASQECSSILYIIGYDWEYNAYDHGN